MRSHYRVATAAVLLVGLSPAGGSALSAQRATDAFEWRGTVLQGSAIEIKGVNGEVTAEPSSGPEVEVTAVKTGRRSDPSGVRIEVVTHGDGVTVCAVYPDVDGRPNECRPGDGGRMSTRDNDVNVAFTVKVPAGVRFVGRTVPTRYSLSAMRASFRLRRSNHFSRSLVKPFQAIGNSH